MSHHHKEETIVCPNCGFHATKNYCAQCGQETHLHKETFFGLIFHFVSHYFHYDSKFWQTLKTLVTKPGKLTVEYWEKKRARYIPPISLYIFVSAVFFIIFFSTIGSKKSINDIVRFTQSDSLSIAREKDSLNYVVLNAKDSLTKQQAQQKAAAIFNDPKRSSEILDSLFHAMPKFFFFMIPIMAFVLKLLYVRRKTAFFVDHAVFSLHIHAFSLMMMFVSLYQVPDNYSKWYDYVMSFVQDLMFPVIFIYLVIAVRNAYKSGWFRSIMYGMVIFLSYIAAYIIIGGLYFAFIAGKMMTSGSVH